VRKGWERFGNNECGSVKGADGVAVGVEDRLRRVQAVLDRAKEWLPDPKLVMETEDTRRVLISRACGPSLAFKYRWVP
jgi:hypothetical protein